jgi:hypothetical protein
VSGSAVPPASGLPPGLTSEEEDRKLIDAVAARVVRMGLAVPAIFFLESTKPLSYVGSQVLVFLEPFVKSVLTVASYDRFVALLEDRSNVEKLLRRIEDMDEEAREREKEEKKLAKAEKRQAKGEKQQATDEMRLKDGEMQRENGEKRPEKELRAANQIARRAASLPGELPRWRRILGRVRPGRRDTGE